MKRDKSTMNIMGDASVKIEVKDDVKMVSEKGDILLLSWVYFVNAVRLI